MKNITSENQKLLESQSRRFNKELGEDIEDLSSQI